MLNILLGPLSLSGYRLETTFDEDFGVDVVAGSVQALPGVQGADAESKLFQSRGYLVMPTLTAPGLERLSYLRGPFERFSGLLAVQRVVVGDVQQTRPFYAGLFAETSGSPERNSHALFFTNNPPQATAYGWTHRSVAVQTQGRRSTRRDIVQLLGEWYDVHLVRDQSNAKNAPPNSSELQIEGLSGHHRGAAYFLGAHFTGESHPWVLEAQRVRRSATTPESLARLRASLRAASVNLTTGSTTDNGLTWTVAGSGTIQLQADGATQTAINDSSARAELGGPAGWVAATLTYRVSPTECELRAGWGAGFQYYALRFNPSDSTVKLLRFDAQFSSVELNSFPLNYSSGLVLEVAWRIGLDGEHTVWINGERLLTGVDSAYIANTGLGFRFWNTNGVAISNLMALPLRVPLWADADLGEIDPPMRTTVLASEGFAGADNTPLAGTLTDTGNLTWGQPAGTQTLQLDGNGRLKPSADPTGALAGLVAHPGEAEVRVDVILPAITGETFAGVMADTGASGALEDGVAARIIRGADQELELKLYQGGQINASNNVWRRVNEPDLATFGSTRTVRLEHSAEYVASWIDNRPEIYAVFVSENRGPFTFRRKGVYLANPSAGSVRLDNFELRVSTTNQDFNVSAASSAPFVGTSTLQKEALGVAFGPAQATAISDAQVERNVVAAGSQNAPGAALAQRGSDAQALSQTQVTGLGLAQSSDSPTAFGIQGAVSAGFARLDQSLRADGQQLTQSGGSASADNNVATAGAANLIGQAASTGDGQTSALAAYAATGNVVLVRENSAQSLGVGQLVGAALGRLDRNIAANAALTVIGSVDSGLITLSLAPAPLLVQAVALARQERTATAASQHTATGSSLALSDRSVLAQTQVFVQTAGAGFADLALAATGAVFLGASAVGVLEHDLFVLGSLTVSGRANAVVTGLETIPPYLPGHPSRYILYMRMSPEYRTEIRLEPGLRVESDLDTTTEER